MIDIEDQLELLRTLVNSISTLKYVEIECLDSEFIGNHTWVLIERDEQGMYKGYLELARAEDIGKFEWGGYTLSFNEKYRG